MYQGPNNGGVGAPTTPFYPYGYGTNQYQRLAQMEQQAQMNQQQNPGVVNPYPQSITNPTGYLKGRPVSGIEEARAAQIDLDGSVFIFTDIGNKKIYTKQIDLNGIAILRAYSLDEEDSKTSKEAYVTRAELENALSSFRTEVLERKDLNVSTPKQPQSAGAIASGSVREQPTF